MLPGDVQGVAGEEVGGTTAISGAVAAVELGCVGKGGVSADGHGVVSGGSVVSRAFGVDLPAGDIAVDGAAVDGDRVVACRGRTVLVGVGSTAVDIAVDGTAVDDDGVVVCGGAAGADGVGKPDGNNLGGTAHDDHRVVVCGDVTGADIDVGGGPPRRKFRCLACHYAG